LKKCCEKGDKGLGIAPFFLATTEADHMSQILPVGGSKIPEVRHELHASVDT
jgi:hypothetical protein